VTERESMKEGWIGKSYLILFDEVPEKEER
jgi:hypothetical protein